jgi:hypothetical protein
LQPEEAFVNGVGTSKAPAAVSHISLRPRQTSRPARRRRTQSKMALL